MASVLVYLARRALTAVPVIFGVFLLTFVMTHIVPSDPALLFAGTSATQAQIDAIRKLFGLDQPLYVQLWISLANFLQGNWGSSLVYNQPVLRVIIAALPNTLTLIFLSLLVAVLISIPIGVVSALKRDTWVDHTFRMLATITYGIPAFWLGVNLQLVGRQFPNFPLGGSIDTTLVLSHPLAKITGSYLVDSLLTGNLAIFFDVSTRLLLPVITLAFTTSGVLIRQVRSSMLSALEENYTRTAKAYGLPERYINYRLVLKNAVGPTIVLLGLIFGFLLVGVFYVESIFGLNGIGSLAASAFQNLDYPLSVGIVVLVALLFVAANIAVDVFQAYLDKRIVL